MQIGGAAVEVLVAVDVGHGEAPARQIEERPQQPGQRADLGRGKGIAGPAGVGELDPHRVGVAVVQVRIDGRGLDRDATAIRLVRGTRGVRHPRARATGR